MRLYFGSTHQSLWPGRYLRSQASRVVPALIAKIHRAKIDEGREVEIWGTGAPRREFLHVGDCADALVFVMERYSGETQINVGWGEDVSIRELAEIIATVAGFEGGFRFDTSKPDGAPRKLPEVSKLTEMGWRPRTPLREGIEDAYRWYLQSEVSR
jgi:GDP-L-fucose synthase